MIIDGPDSFLNTFMVSHETMDMLLQYETLLKRWQKIHNLVSSNSLQHIWSRHFADSAQLLNLAPKARYWLDLGSGAGFPGMVIAILLTGRIDSEVHLVESNNKKAAFLDTVRREIGVPAVVHAMRIEDAWDHLTVSFDIVSARALAPLNMLCTYALPFIKNGAKALFLEGRNTEKNVGSIMSGFNLTYEERVSLLDTQSRILIVQCPNEPPTDQTHEADI